MTVMEQILKIREAMDSAGVFLTSDQAAKVTYLFKPWSAVNRDGSAIHYYVGDRRRYEDVVYECRQEHDAQDIYPPDVIPALWLRLDVEHAGTMDDPIPYAPGMEIFNGKYYTEKDVLYLCFRDSGSALYHELLALVGIYVEVAE